MYFTTCAVSGDGKTASTVQGIVINYYPFCSDYSVQKKFNDFLHSILSLEFYFHYPKLICSLRNYVEMLICS